jgi:gluconokinase
VLAWARESGASRPDFEKDWWVAFMRSVGFRDRLAEKLKERIAESGLQGRDDIVTMFDYIDADEGRG